MSITSVLSKELEVTFGGTKRNQNAFSVKGLLALSKNIYFAMRLDLPTLNHSYFLFLK